MGMADSNHSAILSTSLTKLPTPTRTMRKSIGILLAAVLAVCILLILLRLTDRQKTASSEPRETLTNQSSQPDQSQTVGKQQTTNAAITATTAATAPPSAVGTIATQANSNAVEAQVLTYWQAPIEFHGKVVDENTNPVAGAKVCFRWVEVPTPEGNRTAMTESDTEGLFSLQGARGPDLAVSVSKEGYYTTRENHPPFKYGFFANPDFSPDPKNPILFHLRKRGAPEPLVGLNRSYRIPRDGTPVSIDLTTGATATSETGNFTVRCWTNDQGKKSGEKYDWRCVLTVPGGGIVYTDEEFAFLAPEKDYRPSLEIAMPADRSDWNSQVDLNFYFRLADGHYGRMTFSMIAGGHHFCMVDSVLNPSGSRNLEPQ
jgi:hypothetical protein